ncbi:NB-ARC domain-containing protein [Nocardia sp. SYP-A9097]|uniref:NB-ARC domain-containing protein n=1 Tax=Nocardia sp. SYP-A9097 TaxID=2663237 RepID=UPI001891EDCE|nr:NB-ARC domain-containing protein [Nocardia sp. SYP-A9097]
MVGTSRRAVDPDAALEDFVSALNQAMLRAEKQLGATVKRTNLAKRVNISVGSVYAYLKGTTLPSASVLESILCELQLDGAAIGQLQTLRDYAEIARRTCRERGAKQPSRGTYAAELPRDIRQLHGRKAELAQILAVLTSSAQAEFVTVCVLCGVGGVGKTALAVRAARSLEKEFPDGCLFLDLHGYADTPAMSAGEAAGKLLRQLKAPPESVPVHQEDRLVALHELLTDKCLLLVLDNVLDAAHVRALLPTDGDSRVLLTSRSNLNGLDDARRLPITPLSVNDSAELVRELLADLPDDRRPSEEQLVAMTRRCHGLPVAIKIAAAVVHTETWPSVADDDGGIEVFHDGDRDLPALFEYSVARLAPEHARAFTLLGLHAGRDFDLAAVAAIADVDSGVARRSVRHLIEVNLLASPRAGRYEFHDLIKSFAHQRAQTTLTRDDHAQVRARLVDHYLSTADAADRLLTPTRHRAAMAPSVRDTAHQMREYRSAMAQLTADRDNLLTAAITAYALGRDEQCWQLAFAVREFAFITHDIDLWLRTHELALAAAERSADGYAEAVTYNNLGLAELSGGHVTAAAALYRRARARFQQIGDTYGEHIALAHEAWADFVAGESAQALRKSATALAYLTAHGNPRNVAILLRDTATIEIAAGRYAEAVPMVQEALEVFHAQQLHVDEAMAYNVLGSAYRQLDALQQAGEMFSHAAELATRSGSTLEQTRGYDGLGEIAAAQANWPAARMHWNQALSGYTMLRDRRRQDEIRTRLQALPDTDG